MWKVHLCIAQRILWNLRSTGLETRLLDIDILLCDVALY